MNIFTFNCCNDENKQKDPWNGPLKNYGVRIDPKTLLKELIQPMKSTFARSATSWALDFS